MTTQQITAAIQQTPLCSKVDRTQLIKLLMIEIARAVTRSGSTMSENDLRFTSEEVTQQILDEYHSLHIAELSLLIKCGVYGKFGDFYGVNAVSINGWIVGYLDSDIRKRAIQDMNRIAVERRLPAKARITPQGEYASLRKMLGDAYDIYLRGEPVSDIGCCRYKFLTQLGLLKPCDKFKPYIDHRGKVKKDEYEFPTDNERNTEITRLFEQLKVAGQHIFDVVPEKMVDGYWIMFPGYDGD